ncbi:sulfoxide reductase catalytic subunit YedY [Limimonas halophila]|uniref:Sulfoxide reductase catalytic subunit YedY n=1 Tax=Limimonas halophila TaxID=1082479 RepID=A0A1G7TFP4_9PROT|nr:protein-methionine-sulfoxide reductase catalytic subunit MsrP [Limimonas halophila]SDG33922.1 sulfoxide reductase catalytic subunit YedY [Limimonas halophila]
MRIKRSRPWDLPDHAVTDPDVFWNRRRLMQAAGATAVAGTAGAWPVTASAKKIGAPADAPAAGKYPAPRNEAYTLDRPISGEELVSTYNNYYEFGSSKTIWKKAQDLPIRPWTVTIDGAVENEQQIDAADLLARMDLEERRYRHRCVEAWAIAVPWTGFPLRKLVEMAKPLSGAKYVRLETFHDPGVAAGQDSPWYPWPYVEALTIEEATNELALIGTGAYGHPLPKQNGSPLRLVVPWKYGFKSIKGIVRVSFVEAMPKTFWSKVNGREYGFWANVNPEVDHPRWSQATEEFLQSTDDVGFLASPEKVPTKLFNGYAEQVAHLYGEDLKRKYGDRLYR